MLTRQRAMKIGKTGSASLRLDYLCMKLTDNLKTSKYDNFEANCESGEEKFCCFCFESKLCFHGSRVISAVAGLWVHPGCSPYVGQPGTRFGSAGDEQEGEIFKDLGLHRKPFERFRRIGKVLCGAYQGSGGGCAQPVISRRG